MEEKPFDRINKILNSHGNTTGGFSTGGNKTTPNSTNSQNPSSINNSTNTTPGTTNNQSYNNQSYNNQSYNNQNYNNQYSSQRYGVPNQSTPNSTNNQQQRPTTSTFSYGQPSSQPNSQQYNPASQQGGQQKPTNTNSPSFQNPLSNLPSSMQYHAPSEEKLKSLQQQLNKKTKNDEKRKRRRKILLILLLLLLFALLAVAVYFFIKYRADIDLGGNIRVSVNVSEELQSDLPEDASIYKREIFPGDSFDIVCSVRNSNDYGGDSGVIDEEEPSEIYLRFKIELDVDGKKYNNIIVPQVLQTNWHVFNPDEESAGAVWDGYYYYYGKLVYLQSVQLFTQIVIDYANATNDLGGKSASIIISVDAVEADVANIGEGEAWGSAPSRWLQNMKNGVNNSGTPIEV